MTVLTFRAGQWARIADQVPLYMSQAIKSQAEVELCSEPLSKHTHEGYDLPVSFECDDEERALVRAAASRLGIYKELGTNDPTKDEERYVKDETSEKASRA